jgi:hypothetical protein
LGSFASARPNAKENLEKSASGATQTPVARCFQYDLLVFADEGQMVALSEKIQYSAINGMVSACKIGDVFDIRCRSNLGSHSPIHRLILALFNRVQQR